MCNDGESMGQWGRPRNENISKDCIFVGSPIWFTYCFLEFPYIVAGFMGGRLLRARVPHVFHKAVLPTSNTVLAVICAVCRQNCFVCFHVFIVDFLGTCIFLWRNMFSIVFCSSLLDFVVKSNNEFAATVDQWTKGWPVMRRKYSTILHFCGI